MKQIRLLTLLVLLMTAATGAWAQDTYKVSMKEGVKDADKWTVKVGEGQAQALPIGGLKGDGSETVTLQYNGRLKVKGVKATSDAAAAPAGNIVDLSTLTADYEAQNGDVLTGTLAANVKITIADGATVTLSGAVINGVNDTNYEWAGITCLGDATIILSGTNTVKGFYEDYPGIFVPENKTLTIQGDGSLNASSNGYGAGIGGGYGKACGNITIEGGTITATGGSDAAGIGGGYNTSCGNISITGGTVTATGGRLAAGIGSSSSDSDSDSSCGNITITDGVTKVTATAGQSAPNSIGVGMGGSCGTVTIGGTIYWDGSAYQNGGDTYLAQATIEYPAPAAASLIVNPEVGQVIGSDGKNYDANATLPTGVTAVAKICYVGSETGEAAPYNHGLALALSNANGGSSCKWKTSNTDAGHTKQTSNTFTEESGLQYNDATHNSDTYPAFKAAIANNGTAAPTGCSAWFLASGYQWKKMAGAAGLTNLGLTEGAGYWSSSERVDSQAWVFLSGNWYQINKNTGFRVLACLAF